MASLVAVCRSDDYPFERRQIPLTIDDGLTMVVQLSDTCLGCQGNMKPKEMERFVQKFHALSKDEVAVALMVTNKEILSMLTQMVPCVGCRRSVEKLFSQLVETGHPALEPLVVTQNGVLSIKHDYLFDPKAIYALFYVHGSRLNMVMESIPKSKKNKRCNLHSLDSHKTKSLGAWIDIWDVLSTECREEVVLIECDALMDTLENYLRKHRFCSECKSKVLRAYSILVGDRDHASEKGYCPALYEGLRCCTGEGHVHVSCETDFIAHLISRAEPELTGSRRERHAKTLDIAQEEVLTCLGIHLYERLSKIWQKLRAEEQTWQILFYLGVDTLRKNFEVALEKKQGISNLELVCQELLNEELAKEQKREVKRQKKKRKRNNKAALAKEGSSPPEPPSPCQCLQLGKDKENAKFDENINEKSTICASCDEKHASPDMIIPCKNCDANQLKQSPRQCHRPCHHPAGSRSDYSSDHDGCETCSNPSSNDGSDIACLEGVCNHDGDGGLCRGEDLLEVCKDHLKVNSTPHSNSASPEAKFQCNRQQRRNGFISRPTPSPKPCGGRTAPSMPLSLQDMLEASCSSGEDDDNFITEEEIRSLKARQEVINQERVALRKKLREKFDTSVLQRQNGTSCPRLVAKMGQLSMN